MGGRCSRRAPESPRSDTQYNGWRAPKGTYHLCNYSPNPRHPPQWLHIWYSPNERLYEGGHVPLGHVID
eukprot:7151573-Prymnesium_polylepis.1